MTTVTIKELFDINNEKMRVDVCLEFGLVSSRPKWYGKTEPKLLMRFNRTDQ